MLSILPPPTLASHLCRAVTPTTSALLVRPLKPKHLSCHAFACVAFSPSPHHTQCDPVLLSKLRKTQSLCRNPKLQVGSGPAEVPARTPDPAERSATTRFGLHFATEGRNPFWTLLQAMDLLPAHITFARSLQCQNPEPSTLQPYTLALTRQSLI